MRTSTSIGQPRHAAALVLLLVASTAQAHPGHGESSFMQALSHPFAGWDHLLAMLSVGVWSTAMLPVGKRLLGPTVFLSTLCVGLVSARLGFVLPALEVGLALSLVALAAMLLWGRSRALSLGLTTIGLVGLWHGEAHGIELTQASLWLTATGMVLGSALLHAAGLALGARLQALPAWLSRVAAAGLAGVGLALLALGL